MEEVKEIVSNTGPVSWPMMRQYPGLVIPESWDTIEAFVDWYMKAKKPMFIPWDAETIRTDDATAMCIFRKGRFQVELYIIHSGYDVQQHCHPQMEVTTIVLGGGGVCGEERKLYGTSMNAGKTVKIVEGEYHGGEKTDFGKGFMLLSFEHWLGEGPITSAAIQWGGPTAGPIHDELLAERRDARKD